MAIPHRTRQLAGGHVHQVGGIARKPGCSDCAAKGSPAVQPRNVRWQLGIAYRAAKGGCSDVAQASPVATEPAYKRVRGVREGVDPRESLVSVLQRHITRKPRVRQGPGGQTGSADGSRSQFRSSDGPVRYRRSHHGIARGSHPLVRFEDLKIVSPVREPDPEVDRAICENIRRQARHVGQIGVPQQDRVEAARDRNRD